MNNEHCQARAPKVSVCVVTYNQSSYIRECLESLVTQETSFDFEIIIGDDCSQDGTRDIVKEYQEKYPDKVRAILREENIGAFRNVVDCYRSSRGEYIAHMDGDDVALHGKLQRQYDALLSNPDCCMCTHEVRVMDGNSSIIRNYFKNFKSGKYELVDLLKCLPFFAHSSKMFRRPNDFRWLDELLPTAIDIEIHVEQARGGSIFHISDALGGYRVMTGMSGVCQGVNPLLPAATRRVFEKFRTKYFGEVSQASLDASHSRSMMNYAYQALLANNANQFLEFMSESVRIKIISPLQILMYIASFNYKIAYKMAKIRSFAKMKIDSL